LGDKEGAARVGHLAEFIKGRIEGGGSHLRRVVLKKGASMLYFLEDEFMSLPNTGLDITVL